LLVPSEQVYDARLKLAAEGVTDRQTMGYELLDQERGLGTSQFMETISYRRGLEGELARTVASMRGVRNARVHLAIPERSVFVRDARDPSASVFLEVFAGRRPEQEQINAIVNLVAGSVPMMSKEHVTVVDQNGNLLTGKESQSTADQMADQYEYTAKVEERLTRRVASLIAPIVGDGRYRAEVSADLDFSSVEQAEDEGAPKESERLLAQTLSMQERGWLREQLAADFGDEWESVRESGDPEQMKDFARRVLAWGQRFRSRSVTRYGEKLLADVEAFNLDAVNSALEAFPKLLGREE
jgi:flagellar M-ring protein FliF